MFQFPDLTKEVRNFCLSNLAICPWLAGVDNNNRFDPGVFELIDLEAREFASTHWDDEERGRIFDTLPLPDHFPRIALYETIASTAAFLSHELKGVLQVDEPLAQEAIRKVENYISKHGFGVFIQLYGLVSSYENQSALAYYGGIPEKEFLLGKWHRPWIDYSLSDELIMGTLMGNYRLDLRNGIRHVVLTQQGKKVLESTRKMLENSGYLKNRIQWLRISHFNCFLDYDILSSYIWPDVMMFRKEFLEFTRIQPGMKVLEIGCATGSFTYEAGLANLIGSTGHLTCLDPAKGMLIRSEKKREILGIDWVEYRQGKAEELPFPDGLFDAVIGWGFLHFTNRLTAIHEMCRVTRPGGLIASFHPVKPKIDIPFFRQWFYPLLEIAKRRNEQPRDYLTVPEEHLDEFKASNLIKIESTMIELPSLFHDPDKVIQHFIQGVGWFQEELADIPWKDREILIQELLSRGQEVCSKFPPNELIINFPNQMVRALVP